MQTLTVKLPDALAGEIAEESKRRRISKSEVVRERLTARMRKSPTLLEQMQDLIINDPASPGDLSTNKRHLRDYGKGRRR
jgi:Arc/MetJ-type ribon-helix-helix transcriptional regulator